MPTRRISWQGQAFQAADAIDAAEVDRLAALAKVEASQLADFKKRVGRMAAIYLSHHRLLADRPTDVEVEGHLARIRDTACKLLRLLFAIDDRDDPSLRHLDLHAMKPPRLR
jgi:hypothetical protein